MREGKLRRTRTNVRILREALLRRVHRRSASVRLVQLSGTACRRGSRTCLDMRFGMRPCASSSEYRVGFD